MIKTVEILLRHHSHGSAAAYFAVSRQQGKIITAKALPPAHYGVRPNLTFGDIADLASSADLSLPLFVDVYAVALPPVWADGVLPVEPTVPEVPEVRTSRWSQDYIEGVSAEIGTRSIEALKAKGLVGPKPGPFQASPRTAPGLSESRPNAPFVIDQAVPSGALRAAKRIP